MEKELAGAEISQKVLKRAPTLAIAALSGVLAAGLINHQQHSESPFRARPGLVESPPLVPHTSASGAISVEGPNECTAGNSLEVLADQLRRSSVLISTDEALGSGIIIANSGTETTILTNRHVVESDTHTDDGSPWLAPGMVVYNDGRAGTVKRVQIAPNSIDLAIVTVEGDIGPAVRTSTARLSRGNRLMIIGAPLGYEDSVSAGIVSNFSTRETDSGFHYIAIQTDAAINPGNSGGGFFLAGTGELVGITSFKMMLNPIVTAEGMGFAIPIRYIYDFPYSGWGEIHPAPPAAAVPDAGHPG
jgi:S1-C subfamily serine protease